MVSKALDDEATRANNSQFALANEILETALKICSEGGSPKELYPAWRFLRLSRERDIDIVPLSLCGSLVEKIVKRPCISDRNWLLLTWFEEGRRVRANFLELLVSSKTFLPVKRVEFRRVEEGGKSTIFVRAIGAGLLTESTSCASDSSAGSFGYSLRVTQSKIFERHHRSQAGA